MKKAETLAKFEIKAMPLAFFEKAKSEFKENYRNTLHVLQSAEKAFRNLIVLLMKDRDFSEPKVMSRVKDIDESIKKFDKKYRNYLENSGETYKISDYITDMIGIRIVCIYESDIDQIAEILCDHFTEIERTDKSEEIEKSESKFGYKGLHLDLKLNDVRRSLPEYHPFADQRFEVQIRTIVQDAWSEVDHKLKYKRETPLDLKRRISRLAALFELADQEFENVRDKTLKYESEAQSTSLDESKNILNAFTFVRVASDVFSDFFFSGEGVDGIVSDIKKVNEKMTIKDFRTILENNFEAINLYRSYLLGIGTTMTAFTAIRHCLYNSNVTRYQHVVFDGHRKNFDRWKEHGTVFPGEVVKSRAERK
jgi:putative GTP pyrophosphokinase